MHLNKGKYLKFILRRKNIIYSKDPHLTKLADFSGPAKMKNQNTKILKSTLNKDE